MLPQKIHSLIIHEVALYRDGGNKVTEQENRVNCCTGETHTCIPLDFVTALCYTNQTCGAIEGLHVEVLTVVF